MYVALCLPRCMIFIVATVDRRQRELVRIRQLFIPELILRLHHILLLSRKWVPEYEPGLPRSPVKLDDVFFSRNLKRALELANVVADSRYKLYEDFMNEGGKTLAEYLGVVRQAILAGLENGRSDPFRIVTGH